ncbi:hypothetical protein GGX14DRAFT_396255 [Mycena pura]|uniref:Uncharacterized protein n=1 Tax=Mycena pura TaxID=153505 RepID=A0AAD6VHM6_9AGAR|nr:hypothetical protein GGX14DRAFT_396255 [Mycena pura]
MTRQIMWTALSLSFQHSLFAMLQRIKQFFGLGNSTHTETPAPPQYPPNHIYGPPPGYQYCASSSTPVGTHTRDPVSDPEMPDVACPLILNLGPNVEYQLISRVLFIPAQDTDKIGHYITKTRVKDRTYLYNDLQRGGKLTELGPLYLLEEHDPNTSFVLYLRTSKASKTSRTVTEIQADSDKIPVLSKTPIPVEDNSDDEIDKMLIDSITSPAEQESDARFYTPEFSPPPTPLTEGVQMKLERSSAETDSMNSCPVWCSGCNFKAPDGDDDPNEVQLEPGEITMIPDPNAPQWNARGVLWYSARFVRRHESRAGEDGEYEFEWLECMKGIIYHSSSSATLPSNLRTFCKGRKFCQAIHEVNDNLQSKQVRFSSVQAGFLRTTNLNLGSGSGISRTLNLNLAFRFNRPTRKLQYACVNIVKNVVIHLKSQYPNSPVGIGSATMAGDQYAAPGNDILWCKSVAITRRSAFERVRTRSALPQASPNAELERNVRFNELLNLNAERGVRFELVLNSTQKYVQIGKVRLPFYMEPDHSSHKDPELEQIFHAALPHVAKILATFPDDHPVIASFNKYFSFWFQHLSLRPSLSLHCKVWLAICIWCTFQNQNYSEGYWVLGLLFFMAVQRELGEALNLNGDVLQDLLTGRIVPRPFDGPEALLVMFKACMIADGSSVSATTRMLKFNEAHVIYDQDYSEPTFRRLAPSIFQPSAAIPAVLKRNGDENIVNEKPAKRTKTTKTQQAK